MSKRKYAEVETAVREAMQRELPDWRPGWKQLDAPVETRMPPRVRRFFKRIGAKVRHRDGTQEVKAGNAAEWRAWEDDITLPPVEAYESEETYAQAAFHEATHWSGRHTRLNRPFNAMTLAAHRGLVPKAIGNMARYHEEMIAEWGSLFLAAAHGYQPEVERSAVYIKNYSMVFGEGEREWVINNSIEEAHKATEWLLDLNRKEG